MKLFYAYNFIYFRPLRFSSMCIIIINFFAIKHESAFSLVNHSGTKIKKYITLVQIFEEYFRNIIWMKYMFL